MGLDWPSCARCIKLKKRWNTAALVMFVTALIMGIVPILLALQGIRGGVGMSFVFVGSLVPLFFALKLNQFADLNGGPLADMVGGAKVAPDGSAVIVCHAHTEFVRQATHQ
ncbi:hypothetical protein [Rhodococcus sp. NPDC049939]|uniref:hypothetical protein n=1 Tax=Rhodococcus sp. NPDC049939 TaxID=3155511 RepID=UPI0033CD5614